MDWIGLDWIGLDWIGLDWIGLGTQRKLTLEGLKLHMGAYVRFKNPGPFHFWSATTIMKTLMTLSSFQPAPSSLIPTKLRTMSSSLKVSLKTL